MAWALIGETSIFLRQEMWNRKYAGPGESLNLYATYITMRCWRLVLSYTEPQNDSQIEKKFYQ